MYLISSVLLFLCGLFITDGVFSYQSKYIDSAFLPTFKFQLMVLPLFLIANVLLGYAVKFGYKALGNLTFVLAGSKGIEMVILVLMGYIFYAEMPTWKTLVGLLLVVIGLVIAKL